MAQGGVQLVEQESVKMLVDSVIHEKTSSEQNAIPKTEVNIRKKKIVYPNSQNQKSLNLSNKLKRVPRAKKDYLEKIRVVGFKSDI